MFQDITFALRTLRRRPAWTAMAVVTLALGIGANTAIFTAVNAFLFRPLPVAHPGNLVAFGTIEAGDESAAESSYPNFLDIRAQRDVFEDAIAFTSQGVSLSVDGDSRRQIVEIVSDNYFPALGITPLIGRFFTPLEAAERQPSFVLSYSFWQRRFAGDPDIVGKAVLVNGIPLTITGVARKGFEGTESILSVDGWIPATLLQQLYPAPRPLIERRNASAWKLLGRLREGVSVSQGQAALEVLASRLRREYPDDARGIRFKVVPETRARPHIALSGPLPMVAAAFMVLVSLVLLIACANVTSLILARAAGRRSELAVRTALGATRLRLIRQILTETLVVAFAGLLLGAGLAWAVVRWLTSIRVTDDVQVRFDLHPDWRVYAYAGVAALVAALVSGLAPALHSSRVSLSEVLKEGTRAGGSLVRQRFRTSLVVLQVAVSLVLLVCAGLLTRSVLRATSLDLGFRGDHLLMATTDVRLQRYDRARGERFYEELLARARAIPGVRSAALTGQIPLGTDFGTTDLYADVPTLAAKEGHTTLLFTRITPRYFETMGIPLVAGRDFTTRDDTTTAGVAIINQTLAKQLWPNAEPLGKRFRLEPKGPELEVVGVARDAKYRFVSDPAQPYLYIPFGQRYRGEMSIMLHTAVDPASIAAPLRAIYASLDKDMAVYEMKTMSSHLHDGIAFLFTRLAAMLATGLGLLGLIQAVVGLYGVVSYSVAQRTREIGIRMAIGADSGTVLRQVLGQGLAMTSLGVVIGLLLALAVSRLLRSMLVGVTAADVASYAGAAAVLFTCALVAAFVPARRASRLQPSEALRAAD